LLIVSLAAGCSSAPSTVPSAAPAPDSYQQASQAILDLAEVAATPAIDQAEQDMTALMREAGGARLLLGDQADAVFLLADQARVLAAEAMALQVQVRSGIGGKLAAGSPRERGSAEAQFGTVVGTVAFLAIGSMLFSGVPRGDGEDLTVPPLEVEQTLTDGTRVNMALRPRMMGSRLEIEIELTVDVDRQGIVYRETSKGTLSVELCPDAQGNVPLELTLQGSWSAGSGGGTQWTFRAQGMGHVDDDANLASYDYRTQSEIAVQSVTAGGSNKYMSWEGGFTVAGGSVSDVHFNATRASSQADQEFFDQAVDLALKMTLLTIGMAFEQAEDTWQNGYCVQVVSPEMGGVEERGVPAGSETAFTAIVQHKWEGVELQAPVVASLISGQVAVDPSGSKQPAPAAFRYLAPNESGVSASVQLESRSRRGVGTLTLSFVTELAAYELQFDSLFVTNTFFGDTSGPVSVTQHVRAVVPLDWSEEDKAYTGQAPLEYVLFDVPPIIGLGGDGGFFEPCPNETSASGGTFRVLRLTGLGDATESGQAPAIELTIDPGITAESIVPVCPPPFTMPPGFSFPLPTWSVNFASAHNREAQTMEGPFVIKDWSAGGEEVVAIRIYSTTNSAVSFLTIAETTTITLVQK
jgi:hypothetical protein